MSSVEVVPDGDGTTSRVLVSAEVDLSVAPLLQQRLAEASRTPGAIVIVVSRAAFTSTRQGSPRS